MLPKDLSQSYHTVNPIYCLENLLFRKSEENSFGFLADELQTFRRRPRNDVRPPRILHTIIAIIWV